MLILAYIPSSKYGFISSTRKPSILFYLILSIYLSNLSTYLSYLDPSKAKSNEDTKALVSTKKIKKDIVIKNLKTEKDSVLKSDHENEDEDKMMFFKTKEKKN